ncbi:Ubiquinone biosynthesis O-methyltransferase [subsurface metagenome]
MENKDKLARLIKEYYTQIYSGVVPERRLKKFIKDKTDINLYSETYLKLKSIFGYFIKIDKKTKMLDIACGSGGLTLLCQRRGLDCYGVDINRKLIEIARRMARFFNLKNKFYTSPAEKLPFPSNYFDGVISNQTMEHVQDLDLALRECIRVLKPGGIFFLATPDYNSFYEGHYMLPWLPRFPKRIAKLYLRILRRNPTFLDTINYITRKTVVESLKKNKVTIIDYRKMERYRKLEDPSRIKNRAKRLAANLCQSLDLSKFLEFTIKYFSFEILRRQIELIILKQPIKPLETEAVKKNVIK